MSRPNAHSMAFKYILSREIPKVFDIILKDPAFDGIKDRAGKRSFELACYVELWEYAQSHISRITKEMAEDPKKQLDVIQELSNHPANRKESN